jgi:hypothetical protein
MSSAPILGPSPPRLNRVEKLVQNARRLGLSAAGVAELQAASEFLRLVNELEPDELGIKHVGPVWLAWAQGRITGGEVLALAQACVVCGCTDERACRGGCSWVVPGLCSRCARPTAVMT